MAAAGGYMAKDWAKAFYRSTAWKKCRASYISSVHGLCAVCLAKGDLKPGYIVHHKIEITPANIADNMITLNHDNLQYLCHDCHNRKHFGSAEALTDGLAFDEYGELIRL